MSHVALLLSPEAVAAGFTVVSAGGREWLVHGCGNAVCVSEAVTEAQLAWSVGAHRCGPAGSQWHIGVAAQPDRLGSATSRAHLRRARQAPPVQGRRAPGRWVTS